MLELPNVMLCAVSSVLVEQTRWALERSCQRVRFGDVVLFTHEDPCLPAASPVRWVQIEPILSREAYSDFIIKNLNEHVDLSHVLIAQWDGYVLDPLYWDPAFLEFDYIGAVWPQFSDGYRVGNGGFSLRSKRLMAIVAGEGFLSDHPEDTVIARDWRDRLEREYSIRFADEGVAQRFSVERSGQLDQSFGFHGFYNMPDVLEGEELQQLIDTLPNGSLQGRDGGDFILRLISLGQYKMAVPLLQRRMRSVSLSMTQIRFLFSVVRQWGASRLGLGY